MPLMKLATLTRIGRTRRVQSEHSLPLAAPLSEQLQNAQSKKRWQVGPSARAEWRQDGCTAQHRQDGEDEQRRPGSRREPFDQEERPGCVLHPSAHKRHRNTSPLPLPPELPNGARGYVVDDDGLVDDAPVRAGGQALDEFTVLSARYGQLLGKQTRADGERAAARERLAPSNVAIVSIQVMVLSLEESFA